MTIAASDVREPGFLAKTGALLAKDLKTELRARDTLPPMLAFAAAVCLLLAFTIPARGTLGTGSEAALPLAQVLAGFLWIAVLFAGLIGFARMFEVERTEGALDALLLVPVDRAALFISKAVANLVFIGLVQVIIVPLFIALFGISLQGRGAMLVLVVLLVDIGFVTLGTLFAALAAQTSSKELMLPILALPALVPVFIGAIELTAALFVGAPVGDVAGRGWFGILVAFDVVFSLVGVMAFEYALDAS